MAYDIFISYRRTDQPVARALVEQLEARGLKVWWDQKIEGGEDWRDAIVAGLEASASLVILFSDECNESKQLKKEMAIADTLDKLVIPVLIEDTKPKGHFLYELAARNWIQVFPDPASRASDLADRLARELDHVAPAPADTAPAAESFSGEATAQAPGSTMPAPAPAAPAASASRQSQRDEQEIAEIVRRKVEAKRDREEKRKTMRDFMPFRFLDLVGLIPLGFLMFIFVTDEWYTGNLAENIGVALLTLGFTLGLYGAFVFPFRYYLRKRRVWRVLYMGVLNAIVPLLLIIVGLYSWWEGDGAATLDEGIFYILLAGILVVLISIIIGAFTVAVAGGRRAMNAFNKNVEVL
ncbi:MAG: toll/interleukin-1 receptor domain-containing protein [Pseudomonadota bacterium]